MEGGADPVKEVQKALPRLADGVEEGDRLSRRMGTKDCVVEAPAPGLAPQERSS